MQLDRLDRAILDRLRLDGRATHAAIGRELGMSGPAVYARVKRLEDSGIIRSYTIITDPKALGAQLTAIIRVTTRPSQGESDAFEALALRDPRVQECHDVDGDDSYILKVACASTDDLRSLVVEIRTIPQVLRTITSIVLHSLKGAEAGE